MSIVKLLNVLRDPPGLVVPIELSVMADKAIADVPSPHHIVQPAIAVAVMMLGGIVESGSRCSAEKVVIQSFILLRIIVAVTGIGRSAEV